MSKLSASLIALVGLLLIVALFMFLLYGCFVAVSITFLLLVVWIVVVLMYYLLTWWFSRRS